ncbi:hypothetical protein KIPB_014230, partial [Kipferlia bialata]|eukprot:g14230.t1
MAFGGSSYTGRAVPQSQPLSRPSVEAANPSHTHTLQMRDMRQELIAIAEESISFEKEVHSLTHKVAQGDQLINSILTALLTAFRGTEALRRVLGDALLTAHRLESTSPSRDAVSDPASVCLAAEQCMGTLYKDVTAAIGSVAKSISAEAEAASPDLIHTRRERLQALAQLFHDA